MLAPQTRDPRGPRHPPRSPCHVPQEIARMRCGVGDATFTLLDFDASPSA